MTLSQSFSKNLAFSRFGALVGALAVTAGVVAIPATPNKSVVERTAAAASVPKRADTWERVIILSFLALLDGVGFFRSPFNSASGKPVANHYLLY